MRLIWANKHCAEISNKYCCKCNSSHHRHSSKQQLVLSFYRMKICLIFWANLQLDNCMMTCFFFCLLCFDLCPFVLTCDRLYVCLLFFDMFVAGDMFHMMTCLLSLFAMFWHVCLFHIVTWCCVCCVSLLSLWPFSTRLTLITPYPGSGENCLTLYVQNGVPHCLILFDIVWHCFSPHCIEIVYHIVWRCLKLYRMLFYIVLHGGDKSRTLSSGLFLQLRFSPLQYIVSPGT